MAYKVFVSYSTKDISLAEHIKTSITNPLVEVFIAEYSIKPGEILDEAIIAAIKTCDLFVLLWSRNSKSSEYVPGEVAIARGDKKIIIPLVLEDGLELPAFIKDVKYTAVYRNPSESFDSLKRYILTTAEKREQTKALVILGLTASIVWLASSK